MNGLWLRIKMWWYEKRSKVPPYFHYGNIYQSLHESNKDIPLMTRETLEREALKMRQELATLHEQIMRYQADPQYDARFLDGQDKTLAAMKEQHSADLREVAEMAIDVVTTGNKTFIRANSRSIADSIVREFREQKAKVGK